MVHMKKTQGPFPIYIYNEYVLVHHVYILSRIAFWSVHFVLFCFFNVLTVCSLLESKKPRIIKNHSLENNYTPNKLTALEPENHPIQKENHPNEPSTCNSMTLGSKC